MKILQINSCNFGSTGNIMINISNKARKEGNFVITSCPDGRSMRKKMMTNHIYIGDKFSKNFHLIVARFTGMQGCYSRIATSKFLYQINKFQPDIIHLHNLHNCYINLPMLFNYIKKNKIKVIWTLHDCWAFTGHCPHFTIAKCNKWKTGCFKCPQYKDYPTTYIDITKKMWEMKRKWFIGVDDLTIVTPSNWLCKLVKESFLREYPVKVINNGINLSIFKPRKSNFRQKYGIPDDKFILLGVAFVWNKNKGLDLFINLANSLSNKYQIVLVGTNDLIDREIPNNIISIHCTQDQIELAEIYTAADLFLNLSREENYPTVNMEALACGTPVLAFNVGGNSEIINENCGVVVECDDIKEIENQINKIKVDNLYTKEACLERAKSFNMDNTFEEYVNLYSSKMYNM